MDKELQQNLSDKLKADIDVLWLRIQELVGKENGLIKGLTKSNSELQEELRITRMLLQGCEIELGIKKQEVLKIAKEQGIKPTNPDLQELVDTIYPEKKDNVIHLKSFYN
jgi:hypothetical protein